MGAAMTSVGRLDPVTLMFGWSQGAAPRRVRDALQFSALELTKLRLLRNGTAIESLGGDIGVNLIAGCVSALLLWPSLRRVPQEVLKQGIQGGLFTNTFDAIAQTCGTSVVPQTGAFTKLMRDRQGFAMTNYVDVLGTPPATSASRYIDLPLCGPSAPPAAHAPLAAIVLTYTRLCSRSSWPCVQNTEG